MSEDCLWLYSDISFIYLTQSSFLAQFKHYTLQENLNPKLRKALLLCFIYEKFDLQYTVLELFLEGCFLKCLAI